MKIDWEERLAATAVDASLTMFTRGLSLVVMEAFLNGRIPLEPLVAMEKSQAVVPKRILRSEAEALLDPSLVVAIEELVRELPSDRYDEAIAAKRWAHDLLLHVRRIIDGSPAGQAIFDIAKGLAKEPKMTINDIQQFWTDPTTSSDLASMLRAIADEFRVTIRW